MFVSFKSNNRNSPTKHTVYNHYFNFTSKDVDNAFTRIFGGPQVADLKIDRLEINSDLGFIEEHYRYAEVKIHDLKSLDNLNLSAIEGASIKIANPEELSIVVNTLANFSKIKSLKLELHQIQEFPERIFDITSIQYLDLKLGTIEKLPDKFDQFNNLIKLSLDAGSNVADLPSSLQKLKHLRILKVSCTSVNKKWNLEGIENVKPLEYLRLCNMEIHLPQNFHKLSNIKLLEFYPYEKEKDINHDLSALYKNNYIKSILLHQPANRTLDNMDQLTDLEELYLSQPIEDLHFDNLSNCKSLTKLIVVSLPQEINLNIANINSLIYLSFQNCKNVIELPIQLEKLENLEILLLKNNENLERININFSKMHPNFRLYLYRNDKLNLAGCPADRVVFL